MKLESIPKLIVGFIFIIFGLGIILYTILEILPTDKTAENVAVWAIILIIGLVLSVVGYVAIDKAT
jgi:drug/metabolite transporter (DMT)-like permease